MPYHDDRAEISAQAVYDHHQRVITQIEDLLEQREAMLCAVLTTLGTTGISTMLSMLDEKESGVTGREIVEWWLRHRHEDEVRRHRELEQRQERFERFEKKWSSFLSDLTEDGHKQRQEQLEKKWSSFRSNLTEEELAWHRDGHGLGQA